MSIELRLDDDNQIVCDWGVITDWAPIGCSTTEQIRHLWMLRTDWIAHALFYGKPFLTPLGVIEVTATDTNTHLHLQTYDNHYVWEMHPVCGPGDPAYWATMMLGVWRD